MLNVNKSCEFRSAGCTFECIRKSPIMALHLQPDREQYRDKLPNLYGYGGLLRTIFSSIGLARNLRKELDQHLAEGEPSGAVVIYDNPLLVASYNPETDGVCILFFEQRYRSEFGLEKGKRVLVLNRYGKADSVQSDLIVGPKARGEYQEVKPVIADFFSPDFELIEKAKKAIDDRTWNRIHKLGVEYLKKKQQVYRDGRPFLSFSPN